MTCVVPELFRLLFDFMSTISSVNLNHKVSAWGKMLGILFEVRTAIGEVGGRELHFFLLKSQKKDEMRILVRF